MIAYLHAFIGNTNRNPLVQVKETENKWDLLARVVGAQISSYGVHRWLEVSQTKWVRTNNYKFHTFRSVHFDPSLSPRPSFRFSEGLVPRLLLSLWSVLPPCDIHPQASACSRVLYTLVRMSWHQPPLSAFFCHCMSVWAEACCSISHTKWYWFGISSSHSN